MSHLKMDWEYPSAEGRNIALTGEVNLPTSGEFPVAVACGGSYPSNWSAAALNRAAGRKRFGLLRCRTCGYAVARKQRMRFGRAVMVPYQHNEIDQRLISFGRALRFC